jgi:hypothetical protein
VKKYVLLALLFFGCAEKPHSDIFIRLDNVPPDGKSRIFNTYTDLFLYFRKLSTENEAIMMERLRDNHPVIDSLRWLVKEWARQDTTETEMSRPMQPTTVTISGPKEIIIDKVGK